MGYTIAQKIIAAHTSDPLTRGQTVRIKIDQTLTQDSTGTMCYLQFEALGIDRVKTELSVAYIDHNTLQTTPNNADDHLYIQTVANKHGIRYSKAGNGICHQVHLERFGIPGKTLLGSDSHTPTCGGLGMLAIGAGGLDVAAAMGGYPYYITMPGMLRVNLVGVRGNGVSAKDVILEVLRQLSVKGGVGYVVEYAGEGVADLSVPERATITNMGAELGATSSIFPSDDVTKAFLTAQNRASDYAPLCADADAVYDKEITVDLSTLVPMVAQPHMPDNVCTVASLAGMPVTQVFIGSCTNASLADMLTVAAILKGKKIADNVSCTVAPGSKQTLTQLSECGALTDIVKSGARLLECTCGPCIGMGQSPITGGVSLRTNNRNFKGRSGTPDAQVYLVSPETAAVSAIAGVLTDPTTHTIPKITLPDRYYIDDSMVLLPTHDGEVVRGPNIKPFPQGVPVGDFTAPIGIKVGDNITTDHIMPSGSSLLPFRSNIPYLADYCLTPCDAGYPARARNAKQSVIVGGENYGQGSSREHAALVPLYLGVRAVIAKSFARIHCANLINNGILPLVFDDPADYDAISEGDTVTLTDAVAQVRGGKVVADIGGRSVSLTVAAQGREIDMVVAGGLLKMIADQRAE